MFFGIKDLPSLVDSSTGVPILALYYQAPVLCLWYQGRNNIQHGPFWLGKLGMAANVLTICWTIFSLGMYSFPATMPVRANSMNYVSVVYAVVVFTILVDWFARGRRSFKGEEFGDVKAEALE